MFNTSQPELPPYVVLRKSTRARKLALRLDTKERIFHLVVPQRTSLKKAQAFAEAHDRWMLERLEQFPPRISLIHGAEIPLFGTFRTINITLDTTLKRTSITLEDKELKALTYLKNSEERLQRFLKKTAKKRLGALAHEKAAQTSKKLNNVQVRDTKSRWGSCTSDGRISLSWRLIFAPYETLDYVVAHEVAHLTHLNHGRKFWALCEELSHDFEEGRYWIKHNSDELMRYG